MNWNKSKLNTSTIWINTEHTQEQPANEVMNMKKKQIIYEFFFDKLIKSELKKPKETLKIHTHTHLKCT